MISQFPPLASSDEQGSLAANIIFGPFASFHFLCHICSNVFGGRFQHSTIGHANSFRGLKIPSCHVGAITDVANRWRGDAAPFKSGGHWTNGLRPLPRGRMIPSEQFLFNLFAGSSKPLFGAGCSFLPMLNLPRHLLSSIFGRSEFHGKLVRKTRWLDRQSSSPVGRRFESAQRWPVLRRPASDYWRLLFGRN